MREQQWEGERRQGGGGTAMLTLSQTIVSPGKCGEYFMGPTGQKRVVCIELLCCCHETLVK